MSRISISLPALVTLYLQTTLARSDDGVSHFTLLYDWGFYGLHPKTWYRSFKQPSPLLNFRVWDDRCDDRYYLLSPRGTILSKPRPLIVDGRGNLVWTSDRYAETTVVQVHTYNGKEYLTFWAGIDGVISDETYQVFKTLEPVGDNLRGNLHDFVISRDDTAMFTAYQAIPMDLSSAGRSKKGWILEYFFQEVDIEIGKLLFEWKASDHVPVGETRLTLTENYAKTPGGALDYFHVNSVDKDAGGNYIISARPTRTPSCAPVQREKRFLGGKNNTFQGLSDGRAVDFTWQHHARLHDNNTLSIFVTGKPEWKDYVAEYSRGMLVSLATEHMTATLLREFADPKRSKLSQLQGSAQAIENSGSWLVSYGLLPTFTEFGENGQVLETQKKDALEVSFAIEGTMPPFLRVVALDRDGGVLANTDVLHKESGNAPSTKLREWLIRGGVVLVIFIVALVFYEAIRIEDYASTKQAKDDEDNAEKRTKERQTRETLEVGSCRMHLLIFRAILYEMGVKESLLEI
ncbi:hypothetical protein DL767_006844 [Monosporascus sp. MG133]|nr:hypothetical protein DL767_006844 [Monosporascus sp. MG133]